MHSQKNLYCSIIFTAMPKSVQMATTGASEPTLQIILKKHGLQAMVDAEEVMLQKGTGRSPTIRTVSSGTSVKEKVSPTERTENLQTDTRQTLKYWKVMFV